MWHLDARYEGCCKKMSSHILYDQLVGIITSHLNEMSSAIPLLPPSDPLYTLTFTYSLRPSLNTYMIVQNLMTLGFVVS
jgi:hypothetical protein